MTGSDWIVIALAAAILTATILWDRHVARRSRDVVGDRRAHQRLLRELERHP